MFKRNGLRLLAGILSSIIILGGGFYFFLFPNPLNIHQANILKWIPVGLCFAALYASGKINQETPVKFLPLLFIPFIIFDLFNYFYFPFILILFGVGTFAIIISRKETGKRLKAISTLSVAGIFIYFLLSQPLIMENEGFGRNLEGELVNATVLWSFSDGGLQTVPAHVVYDEKDEPYNLNTIKGKTYFVALWATWCIPCIEKKPQLDSLKAAYRHNQDVAFVDLSIDEEEEKWRTFLEKHNPEGLQLISKTVNETRRALNISSLPLHFVVNPDGRYKAFASLETAQKAFEETVQ
ncbi:TlpA family protein disulfide reductase [Gracilimonas sp.]|uniref:TlpA family protein disulfide reductase n=1 Tax=Gracilimonas sp. TaxID=1974203 RepID=UPI00287162EE|nr:TlpA disulfide reductase family protein [Gracilimonas sp.]